MRRTGRSMSAACRRAPRFSRLSAAASCSCRRNNARCARLLPRLVVVPQAGVFFPGMKRIAILGPGLLGGSIALKLNELGGHRVALWTRREEAIAEIRASGCADAISTDLRAI